ncbi:hypothetical protein [Halomonas sp. IOP_31]|uniref:hypothetical protein n=1 Tax=Halomonas sp. IOP_31 TaxID=2876584 RepID=UPI001E5B8A2D|nr:hypothetical protein [Halomonas sp. IOP_31]MCD6006875.1 hypothetical protein [Halomonas sp. IOP_31]
MDRSALSRTFRRMTPRGQMYVRQMAEAQGVSVEDVVLDEMLGVAGPLKDQLYSLKRKSALRAV